MIVYATILLVGVLVFKLVHDFKMWLNGFIINHRNKKGWLVLSAACIPSIVLYTISSSFHWWIAAPLSAVMCSLFIWLFFDGFYNVLRGFNWWYTGTDDFEDATTDNFLQAIPLWFQIIIKTVPLGIVTYIYISSL